jgi:hypothetical protein
MTLRSSFCCGVRELHGISIISDPRQAIGYTVAKTCRPDGFSRCAFILFTAAGGGGVEAAAKGYWHRLRHYIEEQKLGEIVEGPPRRNPNTGNWVIVYIWALDRDALVAWAKKHPAFCVADWKRHRR